MTSSPCSSLFGLCTSPLPSLSHRPSPSLHISSIHKRIPTLSLPSNPQPSHLGKLSQLLQYGALLTSVHAPAALAVTGNNNEDEDLVMTLVGWGIVAVIYLFVTPPILFNWMRVRWYRRKFFELYFQFLCVFLFFPGMLLWAPFINFRKFPRDPTMKNPWDTPKEGTPLYKPRGYQ